MGFSYHKTEDDYFITINGKPFTDYHPADVRDLIASFPKEEVAIIEAAIKSRLLDNYEKMTGIELPDNYAEHAGRPSITELPFMRSENDGYPYLPGHTPMCNGKEYYNGMCQCKYDKWNHPGGKVDIFHTQMWPGGPCIDDFDM